MHQADVYHRHFINNDHICIQRIFFIPVKMHAAGAKGGIFPGSIISCHGTGIRDARRNQLQHSVNGTGLITGSFCHPLCRASGRCSQKDLHSLIFKILDNGIDGGSLSCTGTSGDH